MCISCAKYLCLGGWATPTIFLFYFLSLFFFNFGVRYTGIVIIVSNSSIVKR